MILISIFGIPHKTLCLPLASLHKLLFSHASRRTVYSQERLKTTTYIAKFGGKQSALWGIRKQYFVYAFVKLVNGQVIEIVRNVLQNFKVYACTVAIIVLIIIIALCNTCRSQKQTEINSSFRNLSNCPSHFAINDPVLICNNSIALYNKRFEFYLTYLVNIDIFSKT